MAGRRTNLALLVLLVLAFATGVGAFAIGTPWGRWMVAAHGALGLGLVLLSPWKSIIVRRGLARATSGTASSLLFLLITAMTVAFGVLHSTGWARSLGVLTAMQIHVGAALVTVPLISWHVIRRPVRVDRMDLSRRQLLKSGSLLAGSGISYLALERVVRLASLPGERRRFTGSYETGSFAPDEMPVTQWLDDDIPSLDPDSWRLLVRTPRSERTWSYEELASFQDVRRAAIDCTGGWWAHQDWEGVSLHHLLGDLDERSILVSSKTGYSRRFPARDAPGLLLATRVGGEPLSAGHGAPARIVAPGRRGFWWVKWVVRIEAGSTPWWVQSPFPLT